MTLFDTRANVQRLKFLTIVDEFTLKLQAIAIIGSIRLARVVNVMVRLISRLGVTDKNFIFY